MENQESAALLGRARKGDADAFSALVAPHRRELVEHCYRMLGSIAEADDVVQDSLVRAWNGLGGFEERASLRTWLHRIATNACLSAAERRPPRFLPAPGAPADASWLEPFPGEPLARSPEARRSARESVALAFLVALQRLPPRQRAVLLLRDVLEFSASEVAELLGDSVAATNSALQRAREAVGERPARRLDPGQHGELLGRYLQAWEAADIGSLVTLLTEEARLSMPPIPQWFEGRAAIEASIGAMVFTPDAAGTMRGVFTNANALPTVAIYRRSETGAFLPMGLHVLEVEKGLIAEITAFLAPALFTRFGLPASL